MSLGLSYIAGRPYAVHFRKKDEEQQGGANAAAAGHAAGAPAFEIRDSSPSSTASPESATDEAERLIPPPPTPSPPRPTLMGAGTGAPALPPPARAGDLFI
jgi:hypothetical protein